MDSDLKGIYGQRFDSNVNMVGAEFLINDTTTGDQQNTNGEAITTLSDGTVVVTWQSDNIDGDGKAIVAKMYAVSDLLDHYVSIDPAPVVADPYTDHQVNTFEVGTQMYSHIVALYGGGYVIVWESDSQDGDGYGVFGQLYDAFGQPEGTEFQINSNSIGVQDEISLAPISTGGFIVTWTSTVGDGSGDTIKGQIFDSTAGLVGTEFQVNSYVTSNQRLSDILVLDTGDFIIFWASDGQDGSWDGIYGQRYNADGTVDGLEFRVNTSTALAQTLPASAKLADGSYVVVWQSWGQDGSDNGIFAQRYTESGVKIGGEFLVNTYTSGAQTSAEVVGLENGNYVIVWKSYDQDGNWNVYGQMYGADDVAIGSEFRVNTVTSGDQAHPSITALNDGGFIVSYEGVDNDGMGMYGQRYDDSGNMVGTEFLINDIEGGIQRNPKGDGITALSDGTVVATWQSDNIDGDGTAIVAKHLENHIAGASGADILAGTLGDDLFTGNGGADIFDLNYANFGNDTISDFEDGIDLIDFTDTGLIYGDLTISVVGSDTVIDDGLGNSITLLGITSAIDQSDFIF